MRYCKINTGTFAYIVHEKHYKELVHKTDNGEMYGFHHFEGVSPLHAATTINLGMIEAFFLSDPSNRKAYQDLQTLLEAEATADEEVPDWL